MTTTVPELTPEQIESFGEELDAIRERVVADLGERDASYIRKVIRAQRGLEVAGRGLMFAGLLPARVARRGDAPCRCRRSSTTWRSATTSCTVSTTG